MKKIVFIACALTCTVSLYAGHSKELKLMSPEGVHEVMFRQERISSSVNEMVYQVNIEAERLSETPVPVFSWITVLGNWRLPVKLIRQIVGWTIWKWTVLFINLPLTRHGILCMESAARYMTLIMQLPCTFLKGWF